MIVKEPIEPPPAYSPTGGPSEAGPSRSNTTDLHIPTSQGTFVYSEHDNKSILTPTPTQMAFPEHTNREPPPIRPLEIPAEPQHYPPTTSPLSQTGKTEIRNQFQAQLFARCARGDHEIIKKYGKGGIICAVICFPVGWICLLLDVQKKCSRCGVIF
ncbi:hypothetical protein QCA50_005415 [Cerrena zonata]|uniref:Brain protein I3 n=1 Tax=Cerrena zonata TaxID=2478898 RepID=A0AAW0GF90_9APHY